MSRAGASRASGCHLLLTSEMWTFFVLSRNWKTPTEGSGGTLMKSDEMLWYFDIPS